uniref:Uncharacterized protein n=1 Tax=Oryza meridionalis TaxID=40149 RepID=A0A0E0C8U1_9ORYZ
MERRRRRYDVASDVGPPNYLSQRREGRGSGQNTPASPRPAPLLLPPFATTPDLLPSQRHGIRAPASREDGTYRTLTRTLPQAHVPSLQPASRRELYGSADADADADARPTHTARFDSHAHAHALPAARGAFCLCGHGLRQGGVSRAKGRTVGGRLAGAAGHRMRHRGFNGVGTGDWLRTARGMGVEQRRGGVAGPVVS